MSNKKRCTSASDNGEYPQFCLRAAKNPFVFMSFRRNEIYNLILEHVSEELGQKYLDVIESREPDKRTMLEEFLKNDKCGRPLTYRYCVWGKEVTVSPTTLRYIKVLQDMEILFGERKFGSVAEIGVGYAGQCRILCAENRIAEYTLIDLPEPLALAKRYLKHFDMKAKVDFADGTNLTIPENKQFDLVISNYAFSELIRVVQDMYLDRVILKSKAGYITWNRESLDKLDGYSLEELLEKIPGSHIIEETPLTAKDNCIIVWGD